MYAGAFSEKTFEIIGHLERIVHDTCVRTPPYGHLGIYGHLITGTFFRPGKTAIHFLIRKKKINAVTRKYGQRPFLKTQIVDSFIISK